MQSEIFALVVGGGPVGLSAAIELRWRGVPTMLISENLETTKHPKCNTTHARSMEHFRRLGIASKLRATALPDEVQRASAYVTRFCGREFARLPRAFQHWPTPENPNNVSQIILERTLLGIAEQQDGAQIHYGWRLDSFADNGDGVIANITSTTSGEQRQIKARYLLGIDGASSTARKALGFRMIGDDGTEHRAFMGGTMLSYYIRAPGLLAASGRAPTHMTWIINHDMRAMMYAQDGKQTWVVHYQVPKGVDPKDVDPQRTISTMLGAPMVGKDVEFENISGGPWTGGLALVAEHYQAGNVFLAGDAAHLFTPLGGLGMNTGIGDVMNLGWKIAAHHQGWAGERLLNSYETERHPMGLRNVQLGVHCTRIMDGWVPPPDLEADGDAAEQHRRAFGEKLMAEDRIQYHTVGLQLGERYETSPVICADDSPAPPDPWDSYTPLDRPGARAPHFWLEPGRALFDECGQGFTLLDFGAPGGAAALMRAAESCKMPVKVLRLEKAPDDLYRHKLVLIRPDQHIAWHGDSVADAGAVIDRVRGA
jgi:2-polyprenyl-6-methoxyphenol hydroxylase-like FAD-dependent oxidoreductase